VTAEHGTLAEGPTVEQNRVGGNCRDIGAAGRPSDGAGPVLLGTQVFSGVLGQAPNRFLLFFTRSKMWRLCMARSVSPCVGLPEGTGRLSSPTMTSGWIVS